MRIFGDFVNFTVANSHFLSAWRKRKLPIRSPNTQFSSPTPCLKTQIGGGFQSRTRRWQNTIFDFLEAQLDFLAKFSSLPYSRWKNGILRNSKELKLFPFCGNSLYFIGSYRHFYSIKTPLQKQLQKSGKLMEIGNFPWFDRFLLWNGKIGLLDQFFDQITWSNFWLFSPTLQAVRGIFCRNMTGFFSDFSGGSNPLRVLFFASWSQIFWPKICAIFIKRPFCPTSPPKKLGSIWIAEGKKLGAISSQPDLPSSSYCQKKV